MFLPFANMLLVSYISPTILFVACAYVIIFSKLRINAFWKKLIGFFAPAAFGVYLIHVHHVVWDWVMDQRFVWIADSPIWLIPIQVIGCAAGIFVVCLFIEKVRIKIFELMKIDVIVEKTAAGVRKVFLKK